MKAGGGPQVQVGQTVHLVLLRGLARESRHWGEFPTALASRVGSVCGVKVQVHTPDLPGAGRHWQQRSPSSVPQMAEAVRDAWLDTLPEPAPVMLVGVSLGGMVATQWALSHPDEVAGVVLMNSSWASLSPWWQRLQAWGALRLLSTVWPLRSAAAREATIWRVTSSVRPPAAEVISAWAAWRRERPVSAVNVMRQLWAAAHFRPQQAPAVPGLVLRGGADRLVHPACSAAIAQRWGCLSLTHQAAGHDVSLDAPEWVMAAIAGWMQGVQLAPSSQA